MNKTNHIAFDLGASSGRMVLGEFHKNTIQLNEIYRFANTPVEMNGILYWDFPKLYQEIKNGMKILAKENVHVDSVSVDTWGVDYGYLDENGDLLMLPRNYRNEQKEKYENEIYKLLSKRELFEETGVYPTTINSIVQIYADLKRYPWLRDAAVTILFMPDLFSYFLTKEKATNYSIASTSGLLNKDHEWSRKIIDTLNFPKHWFKQEIENVKILGEVKNSKLNEEVYKNTKVITSAGHDTAASLLVTRENSVFLSCGTWSIMGVKIQEPITKKKAFELELTNEGTVDGKTKLIKNINGLWILQELQRHWAENGVMYSHEKLVEKAKRSSFNETIDVDKKEFMNKCNMHKTIENHFIEQDKIPPSSVGDFVRVVINSLAEKYKEVITNLENVVQKQFSNIHIVGGGIQNELLCELTAQKTQRDILTGPIEASSFGNILSQLIALNLIEYTDIPNIISNSIEMKQFNKIEML
ncbi:FGGY family carbohydrate kinase [Staphylococcus equorum]|uniref:FGGY family carbohydrate kinase n=1 Tax=Staphylococcus equorum TaxID=246432 RepID=A0A9X4R0C8_9STAP|nr:FGGY-family carbohydrate kinase [Staphylococcus equorum]MDG0841963.1 FGGY family carbohydrate kinase [Staphylococcus equorum]MDG0857985.1 FGGY family carbohydrate kinase [Staphylococcus equorum]